MAPPKKITDVRQTADRGRARPRRHRRLVPHWARRRSTSWSSASSSTRARRTRRWPGSPFRSSSRFTRDRSFTFITKTPPAAVLLKKAAGLAKGSGTPNKDKVGKVTEKQVREIATQKMPDLNAASVDAAVKSIKGTARSMGIEVVG